MARPRSQHVATVKQKLIARLGDGLHRGGDRFFSIRGIAQHFEVSYQTADRLLRELTDEGHLHRKHGSGTYISGDKRPLRRAKLVFDVRARRAGSFGARLLDEIESTFRQRAIPFTRSLIDPTQVARVAATDYPVLWEVPSTTAALIAKTQRGLLLNDRPSPGLAALRVDSIAVDDALGGACAAELIASRVGREARVVVFAGPPNDVRSQQRIAGFMGRFAKARLFHSPTWFRDDALAPARAVLAAAPDGIFACNDRLAQAVLEAAAAAGVCTPLLFGFDDAPVAELLHLSTISIPWTQLASSVATMAAVRLRGEVQTASHLLLSPWPVVRLT